MGVCIRIPRWTFLWDYDHKDMGLTYGGVA